MVKLVKYIGVQLAIITVLATSGTSAWAAATSSEIRELRNFVADIIDPKPLIQGSQEHPERIVLKKHIPALKLIIVEPGIIEESLGLERHGVSSIAAAILDQFKNLGLLNLKEEILNSSVADKIIADRIAAISDSHLTTLNLVIEGAASVFKFDKVGLDKLDLIKVDQGMGKIASFILEVLKNYHAQQAPEDKRFIVATFLRSTMPNDTDDKKLLAVTKASGPFFHKIIQLVGDFVSDATPEGKVLKDTLNEVKRNLLPIDEYNLKKLLEEVERAGNNRFKITVNRTLGVASIGHALLVTLTDNTNRQEKIVLKFIKPGVKERATRDIAILLPIANRLGVLSFLQGTIDDIMDELDFKTELANLKAANEIYNSNDPQDRVGAVLAVPGFPESPKWIAMTLAPGRSFADFGKDPANTSEEKLDRQIEYIVRGLALEQLTNKWMLQAFFGKREGMYHADLHAGNILVDIKTDEIKQFLRSKHSGLTFSQVTKDMVGSVPKNLYKVTLIDFGNAGRLNATQRLNVLNFFIATLDEIHSPEGFLEAYLNLVGAKLDSAKEKVLKEEIKKIFDQNKEQGPLLGKLVTFFLDGVYPPLPPVMANFGRSQAMLNNIYDSIQKDAAKFGLARANFNFSQAILEDLKKLLAEGTFLFPTRVDVAGNKLYLNTGNFLAVTAYGARYGWDFLKEKLGVETVPLMKPCKTDVQCQNWTMPGKRGVQCCQGRCQEKLKAWTGIYYCPATCVGKAFGKAGTCSPTAK
jgi:predicted unusual protein kinase regulating ubiquinone biosynthesis (AarF/ABC1/UbiB family)